jgi:uroporphyrinogen-III synthase
MHQTAQSLAHRAIALPETRELDVFSGLLERRGATVVRCPLIAIRDAPDPQPILHWVREIIGGRCDDLILLTGEGLHRLLSCIERNAPELREPFVRRLSVVRKITRGPKPARALRELGLQPDIAAEIPTTDGIIEVLRRYDLRQRRVGVQLYGGDPNTRLIESLQEAGATVVPVAPYIYTGAADDAAVRGLAQRMRSREIDAIAFTSMRQVQRWFEVLGDEIAGEALRNTMVAAIGPLVAASLKERGVAVGLMPTDSFFLKPLTRALEAALGSKR